MFESLKELFKNKGRVALTVGFLGLGSATVGYNQGCFTDVTPETTPPPVSAPSTP